MNTEQTNETVNARINSILSHDEAKVRGREALAQHLALKTDMSVELAIATLQAAPKPGLDVAEVYASRAAVAAQHRAEALSSCGARTTHSPQHAPASIGKAPDAKSIYANRAAVVQTVRANGRRKNC